MKVMFWALHFAEYSTLLARALLYSASVHIVLYADNAERELGTDFADHVSKTGLRLTVLKRPTSPLDVLRNSWQLVSATWHFRPDILHIQENKRDETIIAIPFLVNIPMVLTVHDPLTHSGHDSIEHRFSRGRIYTWLLRRLAARAITHGRLLAGDLARAVPRLTGRIDVIAHGPLGLLRKHSTVARVLRTPIRLLFFGRIHEYKGLRYFVEAVIALRNRGVRVVGVVAGTGSDLDNFREAMLSAGCFEIRDHFLSVTEVDEVFTTSDVAVLPYTDGTQSGVAAMALGYGLPVVASNVGSIPELVRDGVNGVLVPPRDTKLIVSAIEGIIGDDAKYRRLCASTLDLRDGPLSWSAIAVTTVATYVRANDVHHKVTES